MESNHLTTALQKSMLLDAEIASKSLPKEYKKSIYKKEKEACIDFAKWCVLWQIKIQHPSENNLYNYGGIVTKSYTMEELFEIYKKENNGK